MTYKEPKDFFLKLLSNVHKNEENLGDILKTLREKAEDKDTKEYLDSLSFLSKKNQEIIEKCFNLIGEQPLPVDDKLKEMFLEDFRREFNALETPLVKFFYFKSAVNYLINARIGEWTTLVAMADISGNRGVGVLLESCLAEKMAFVERTRRHIRQVIYENLKEKTNK